MVAAPSRRAAPNGTRKLRGARVHVGALTAPARICAASAPQPGCAAPPTMETHKTASRRADPLFSCHEVRFFLEVGGSPVVRRQRVGGSGVEGAGMMGCLFGCFCASDGDSKVKGGSGDGQLVPPSLAAERSHKVAAWRRTKLLSRNVLSALFQREGHLIPVKIFLPGGNAALSILFSVAVVLAIWH